MTHTKHTRELSQRPKLGMPLFPFSCWHWLQPGMDSQSIKSYQPTKCLQSGRASPALLTHEEYMCSLTSSVASSPCVFMLILEFSVLWIRKSPFFTKQIITDSQFKHVWLVNERKHPCSCTPVSWEIFSFTHYSALVMGKVLPCRLVSAGARILTSPRPITVRYQTMFTYSYYTSSMNRYW